MGTPQLWQEINNFLVENESKISKVLIIGLGIQIVAPVGIGTVGHCQIQGGHQVQTTSQSPNFMKIYCFSCIKENETYFIVENSVATHMEVNLIFSKFRGIFWWVCPSGIQHHLSGPANVAGTACPSSFESVG